MAAKLRTLSICTALLVYAQAAHCAQPSPPAKEVQLYCTGQSAYPARDQRTWPAEALVKILNQGTYVEVGSIGAGLSRGNPKMKMISGTEASGTLTLHPLLHGHDQLDVVYTLNKYSGELTVTTPAEDHRETIFTGKCGPARPLF